MSNQPKSTETSNLNGDLLSQKGDIVAGSTKDSEKSILQYLPNSDLQIEVEDEATIDEDNVDSSNIFNSNSSQKMTEKVIANESFEMSESDLDEVSIESNDKSASEVGEKSEDDQVTDQNDLKDFFDEDGAFVDVDKRKKRDVITNVQSSQVLNNIPSNKSSKVLSHEGHKINLAKPMHSGTVKKIRNFLRIKKTSKSGNVNISTKIFTKSKVDYDDSLLDDLKNETVFTTNLPSQTITQTHLLLTKDKIMNVSKESNAGDQLGLNVKNNTVSTQIILTTNESKEQTPFIVFRMVKKMDVKPSKTVTFEEININNPNITLTNISNTTSPDITNEKGTFDSNSVEKTILETSHETEKMKSFKKLNSAFDHGEESS
uniref:Rab GTPase domain-containing protein n=1 Tax=Rhabditophanes sp. KR3021 TaxID=114890 RepID=A0AC35U721_9BILA